MTEIEQQFIRVQEKMQLLGKQLSAFQKENKQLKEDLENQQKKEQIQTKLIEELNQKLQILKLSSGEMNEKDKKEFEKKINLYLRDIDQCIALLSR